MYDPKELENLKNNVRVLRERTGMSQGEFAYVCGTTQKTISGIETGKVLNPGMNLLQDIAKFLNVSVKDLLSDLNLKPPENLTDGLRDLLWNEDRMIPRSEPRISNYEIEVLKKIPYELTPEGYRQVLLAIRDAARSHRGLQTFEIVPVDDDGKPIDEPST